MSSIHELLKQVYPLNLRMELFNAIWTGRRADIKEKERYEYFFGTNTIKDNKTNQFYGCVVDLLNQQDKRIKELEEELENYKLCRCVDCSSEYEKGLETTIDELEKENQQLKQQLHDLPKKIVEEIRDVAGDYWEECGNVQ